MHLALADDGFCMILNCIYCIVYCCIYYLCINLDALLKPAQYVRIKKYIVIIMSVQHVIVFMYFAFILCCTI